MLKTLWIFAISLMPPILSLWMLYRIQARMQAKLRAIATNRMTTQQRYITPLLPDRYYLEGVGYLIGDISCQFNARSGHLRCAVNPQGPCHDCLYYQEVV